MLRDIPNNGCKRGRTEKHKGDIIFAWTSAASVDSAPPLQTKHLHFTFQNLYRTITNAVECSEIRVSYHKLTLLCFKGYTAKLIIAKKVELKGRRVQICEC